MSALYQFNALISGPNYGTSSVCEECVCVCACVPGFSLWSVHTPYLHVLNSWWCVGLGQCVWWRGCLCAKLKWSGDRAWALNIMKNPVALLAAADRRWRVASFHSLLGTGDTLPQRSQIYGALCVTVICSSSIALEIIANPVEELVSFNYMILATALLILFIPYIVRSAYYVLHCFRSSRFSFDTDLWM